MTAIRVLVVDDSVVVRKLVGDLLRSDPGIEVVGTAVNGQAALEKVALLAPDLITMDVEMPVLDGIEAVRRIRASGNRAPIIMFSTLTERGAATTLEALAAGATDYVAKPSNSGSLARSMDQLRQDLLPRIHSLAPRQAAPRPPSRPEPIPGSSPVPSVVRRAGAGYSLLAVGCSTGGPDALHTVFSALPTLPVPVVVVQHMPPVFTRQLAARLDRNVSWTVGEAEHGQRLLPGTITVAPGDHHLEVVATATGLAARLHQGPRENYCRPAVDVLFRSAAAAAGPGVLGLVLTGMGQDGELGAAQIREAGGSVVVQDEESSVVWGMPGAVARAGTAEAVLPLSQVAAELSRRLPRPVRGPVPKGTAEVATR